MSSSSEFPEASSPKVPAARSSSTHRCNILSQFLKEKGGFGDLSLGITAAATPVTQGGEAMGIFPKQRQVIKSMDLFPSESGFGYSAKEGIPKVAGDDNSRLAKADTAQMTIFYSGQVIVLDDFPTDKAKEIMLLASRSSSEFYTTSVPDVTGHPRETTIKAPDELGCGIILPIPRTPEPFACDLPLARMNSLHRFLEKRKDRIAARAPYPKNTDTINTGSVGSPIPNPMYSSNKSWLSLSAQRH